MLIFWLFINTDTLLYLGNS